MSDFKYQENKNRISKNISDSYSDAQPIAKQEIVIGTPFERQQLIKSQIANSFNTENALSSEELEKSADDFLEKGGKRAVIGERRTFGGREYIKTKDGWKFHGKGTGEKAKSHREGALDHHVEAGKVGKPDSITLDKDHKDDVKITAGMVEAISSKNPKNEKEVHHAMQDFAKQAGNTYSQAEYNSMYEQYEAIKKKSSEIGSEKETNKKVIATGTLATLLKEHGPEKIGNSPSFSLKTKGRLVEENGKTYFEKEEGSMKVVDKTITQDIKERYDQLKNQHPTSDHKFKTTTIGKEMGMHHSEVDAKLKEESKQPSSKHIGDMSLTEMKAQADKLGISTQGKTKKQVVKELTDANIDKQLADFKDKKKVESKVVGDPNNDDHGSALILMDMVDTDEELLNDYEVSQEAIDGANDLKKQGFETGEMFDHREYEKAEKYKAKMEREGYTVYEVNDGSDMINYIIKKGASEGK